MAGQKFQSRRVDDRDHWPPARRHYPTPKRDVDQPIGRPAGLIHHRRLTGASSRALARYFRAWCLVFALRVQTAVLKHRRSDPGGLCPTRSPRDACGFDPEATK